MNPVPEQPTQHQNYPLLFVQQSSTLYIQLEHVLEQINVSANTSEPTLRAWQAQNFTWNMYGKEYLPLKMMPKLLAELEPLISTDGQVRAQELKLLANHLHAALLLLWAVNQQGVSSKPITLAPEWAEVVKVVDDSALGGTPGFGSSFGSNTSVTYNSQTIH
ncbi:hypothetical protein IPC29_06490 [Pseudomonas aeruginosa]|uniref:hypothetical protein n=1 Tax=Pseudomonas aeruginosa TaxID=287 RepID=UPI000CFF1FBF|nr:hypothetical protein [Pseudomonas aeruginosa]EKX3431143.1 hypothetical protein [Pseudomonas aeruginosa]MBX5576789.1 hypothetical protein [Pseudomonas aeruginosa]MCQ9732339.1 hypothetical protein [Pseudomonas aeruginosa]MCS8237035.1 hypothetical protein [Pseudomonas aeruginosa]MCT0306734.1 hypothetical protein [Pseudomonas aeruginosa]